MVAIHITLFKDLLVAFITYLNTNKCSIFKSEIDVFLLTIAEP
jgi:hypothetical protein